MIKPHLFLLTTLCGILATAPVLATTVKLKAQTDLPLQLPSVLEATGLSALPDLVAPAKALDVNALAQGLRGAAELLNSGQPEAALGELDALLAQQSNLAPTHELRGIALARLGRDSEAVEAFARAVEISPAQFSAVAKLADIYLEQRRYQETVDLIRRGLVHSPDAKQLHYRLGLAERGLGNLENAAQAFRAAIPANPASFPAASVLLAQLYNRSGSYAEAEELLNAALGAGDYPHAFGYLVWGETLGHLGRWGEAVQAFQEAVVLAADNPLPHLYLGRALQRGGRQQEAIEALDVYLQAHPDSRAGLYAKAESLFRLQRFADALTVYAGLEKEMPGNPALRKRIADCYAATGQRAEAVKIYRKLVEAGDAPAAVYIALANLLQHSGQQDEVMSTLRGFVERYPERFDSHLALGAQYLDQGDLEQASVSLNQAAQFAPQNPLVIKAQSSLLWQQGRPAEALEKGENLLALTPDDNTFRLQLATMYAAAGQREKAVSAFESVLEGQPGNAVALNNLATLLADTDPERALTFAQRAVKVDPQNPKLLDTLGWVNYKAGHPEKARKMLSALAQKNKDYALVHLHLGVISRDLGDKAAARRHLQRFLKLAPRARNAPQVRELADSL